MYNERVNGAGCDENMKRLHNSLPNGVHYLIELFGCDRKQLNSVTFWKKILLKSISNTSMKILHSHFYKFTPEGLTGYVLISASHLSVHTWAELNYAACDVFSCADGKETERTVKLITDMVKHNNVKIKKMKRGFRVAS